MLMAEIRADHIYEYLPSVSSECVALSSTMYMIKIYRTLVLTTTLDVHHGLLTL